MSRSQFQYALGKCFGTGANNVTLMDATVAKLYATFSSTQIERMDWRCFLSLLVITVLPLVSTTTHLQYLTNAFYI